MALPGKSRVLAVIALVLSALLLCLWILSLLLLTVVWVGWKDVKSSPVRLFEKITDFKIKIAFALKDIGICQYFARKQWANGIQRKINVMLGLAEGQPLKMCAVFKYAKAKSR